MTARVAIAAATLGGLALTVGCRDAREVSEPPVTIASRLVIHENRAARPMYIEGSVSFLRVGPAGAPAEARRTPAAAPGGRTLVFDELLAPGDYRIVSYQRPCDGNCDYLDPPTDRCEATIRLAPDETRRVTLLLRPGAGCEMRSATSS